MPDFLYIQQQNQLDAVLPRLAATEVLAIDTESSGYYTYHSEICLIQISANDQHYIIDALANLHLDQLGKLCKDCGVTKIFHAASSDLAELKKAYQWEFCNIFDTFLASRFLGHASCSLSSLVAEYEGVELKKKEQKSNWKKRPLSRSQLEYACLDTVYLQSLMQKLKRQLQEYDMYEEVSQEFNLICSTKASRLRDDDLKIWRKQIPQAKKLSITEQNILQGIYQLRDLRAREENIAPFRILSNSALLSLVKAGPTGLENPEINKFFHPVFLKKDKKNIYRILKDQKVDILEQAKVTEKSKAKAVEIPSAETKQLAKRLKKWRNYVAEYRGMDAAIILSARCINSIAKECPKSLEALQNLDILTPWKLANYGPKILDIISNTSENFNLSAQDMSGLIRLPQVRENERN